MLNRGLSVFVCLLVNICLTICFICISGSVIRQKSRRKKPQDSGTRIKHKATETEKNKRTQISCYKLINKTKQEKK